MLLRDSLKLKKLNDEIIALKNMLKSSERRDSLKSISKQERIDSLRYANLSGELDDLAKSLQTAVSKNSKDEEVIAKRKIQEKMADREKQKGVLTLDSHVLNRGYMCPITRAPSLHPPGLCRALSKCSPSANSEHLSLGCTHAAAPRLHL